MRLKTLVLLVFLAGCVMTAPDHVAGKYCRLSTAENGRDQIKKILKSDLQILWDQAMAADAQWAQDNPGEKPPFGDGIPTQAFPDFAPICKMQTMSGEGDERAAEIYHGFPNDPKSGWVDQLVLVPEKGSWVIRDIRFAPNYESGLKSILEDAEVTRLLDDREGCEHFRGEEPYDAERAAFLKKNIEELCPGLDKRLDDLQAKYWDNPVILQKLTGLERMEAP